MLVVLFRVGCPRAAAVSSHHINTLNQLPIHISHALTERAQEMVASEAFNLSLIGLIHFNERSHMGRFYSKSLRIHSGFYFGWQPKVRTCWLELLNTCNSEAPFKAQINLDSASEGCFCGTTSSEINLLQSHAGKLVQNYNFLFR